MKKKIFTFFLALVASVGTMFAKQVQIGDLYYNLDYSAAGSTAEVALNGSVSGDITIPSSVTYYSVTYSVTSIGGSAFEDCTGLTSVSIPNSVTSIGGSAFEDCTGLTSVSIPNSVTSIGGSAFRGCSGLTSVTIGNSVTSIGRNAFYECSSLTSVTIGNSVTSIGVDAFYHCSSLTSVSIPNSVTSIGSSAFKNCTGLTSVTIGNSVTSIGVDAFYGCSSLRSINVDSNNPNYSSVDGVLFNKDKTKLIQCPSRKQGAYTIPNSVTSIGERAFRDCTSLTSVTIGNSVTSIGERAFRDCTSLTSVTIGNSVTSIGEYAFYECSSLTSVTINSDAIVNKAYTSDYNLSHIFGSQVTEYIIGDNVKGIGDYAFRGCSSLTSVTIGNSVTSIGYAAFSGCSSLTSITIPNSVTSIGYAAFEGCSSLTSINVNANNPNYCSIDGVLFSKDKTTLIQYPVGKQGAYTIPNSVTSIEDIAFFDCTSLTSVIIPNSVTSIGNSAFQYCSTLTSVTIGNRVTSIGDGAFYGCNKLVDIYCYASRPPRILVTPVFPIFTNYNAVLYVPCESKKAYMEDAVWGKFKYIECISSEDIENVQGDEVQSTKVIKDGQVLILRNGKTYTMQGQEVK